MKLFAIALIVLGSLGLVWGSVSLTRSEKVVDLGPLEIRKEKQSSIPIPPLLGLVGVTAGIVLLSRVR